MTSLIQQISERIENGTVVYRGFRIAFVMSTYVAVSGEWIIEFVDTFRGRIYKGFQQFYLEDESFRTKEPKSDFDIASMILLKRHRSWMDLMSVCEYPRDTWSKEREQYNQRKHAIFARPKSLLAAGTEMYISCPESPPVSLCIIGDGWIRLKEPVEDTPYFNNLWHLRSWYKKHVCTSAIPGNPIHQIVITSGPFIGMTLAAVLDNTWKEWHAIENFTEATHPIVHSNQWTDYYIRKFSTLLNKNHVAVTQNARIDSAVVLLNYALKEGRDFVNERSTFRKVLVEKAREFRTNTLPNIAFEEIETICVKVLAEFDEPESSATATATATATEIDPDTEVKEEQCTCYRCCCYEEPPVEIPRSDAMYMLQTEQEREEQLQADIIIWKQIKDQCDFNKELEQELARLKAMVQLRI